MEQQEIKISKLLLNDGQLPDIPKNPRFIRDEAFEQLKQSIKDYPDMLAMRELVVVPYNDKYVVLGGNMRLRACRELGYKSLPCKVYPADTDAKVLRHFVLVDNKAYGEDDWDALANEWDEAELAEWGIVNIEKAEDEAKKLNKGEVEAEVPFTEILNEEHNYVVLYFDNEVDWLQAEGLFDIKPVKAYPTARSGNKESFGIKYGVGRVLNGAKALEKIRKHYEHIN